MRDEALELLRRFATAALRSPQGCLSSSVARLPLPALRACAHLLALHPTVSREVGDEMLQATLDLIETKLPPLPPGILVI